MAKTFMERIATKIADGKHLCVGLDPDPEKIPEGVTITVFLQKIISATAPFVAVFKPNIAFFEERRGVGLIEFANSVNQIHSHYEQMTVIGDWKKADIGKTNEGTVKAGFDNYKLDAMTVNPYLGRVAMKPFLDRKDRGIILLCRTSNEGAGEFQDLICDVSDDPILRKTPVCTEIDRRAPLYQVVARNISRDWNSHGNCGLVVGATYPTELEIVRQIAPNIFLLIPGVGTQGGDLEASVLAAHNPNIPADFVINVSSGILYAYQTEQFKRPPDQFAQAAADAAEYYDQEIRKVLKAA